MELGKFIPISGKNQGFLFEKSVPPKQQSLKVMCRVKTIKPPTSIDYKCYAYD